MGAGATSCAAGDDVPTSASASSATGATGAGGAGGGAGGAGGAGVCEPGAEEACYAGPPGTEDVGICAAGVKTCAADGSGFGACEGEILPLPDDDCTTPEDDDCSGASAACPGDPIWARALGDAAEQRALAIALDDAGNTLVTGAFAGTMTVAGQTLSSTGLFDVFVVKLDPAGAPLWATSLGGPLDQIANGVAVDASGNVIVTGEMKGTANFGGGDLVSAGAEDMFVLKLDSSGKHIWSKRFGDAAAQSGRSVVTDGASNIVLLASVEGTTTFGGAPLTSAGASDIVLAKLNPGGNHLYSKIFGGAGVDMPGGIALDPTAKLLLTGWFSGTINFGGAALTSAGGTDIFAARLSEAGIHLWSKGFGDASDQAGRAVATDAAGAVLLTGSLIGSADFGGGALKSAGNDDIFVAKLSASGAHVWSKAYGDAAAQTGRGLAADSAGNVLVTGALAGTADFGGGPLTSAGLADVLVLKLDPAGAHLFSRAYGNSEDQLARGLAIDAADNLVVAGQFKGILGFGGVSLTSAGSYDMFVAKLAP